MATSTTTRPRFGLKLGGQVRTTDELRSVWRIADEAGFDHLWVLDLFLPFGAGDGDRPTFEGWALQAAMATATARVRIGAAFTGNTHRPPWLLAKLAVTVDHLSAGRLEFGIGAGYEEGEHRMYDIGGLDHRFGRLRESLECITRLWTEPRVDFHGRYYTLRDAVANPKPVQQPHPPIWIGGSSDQTIRIVARYADVWHCPGGLDKRSGTGLTRVETLEKECDRIGRDPRSVRRCAQIPVDGQDRASLLERAGQSLRAGNTEQIVFLTSSDAVAGAHAAADALRDLRALR